MTAEASDRSPESPATAFGPIEYHERTKHHLHRYAASPGHLDWANQPDPFRRFDGAPLIRLAIGGAPLDEGPSFDAIASGEPVEPAIVNLRTLSSFFEFSLALSAWKQFGASRWALRINPSSGNLHPTEGYLLCGPVEGLDESAGVYHYAPREHGLERRAEIPSRAWSALATEMPAGSFLVGLSSIHWREAWKYGERAFRYGQHDVGHALAAISYAAALHGWSATWLSECSDDEVARLIGLDRVEDFEGAERESPDLLMAVGPPPSSGAFNAEALVERLRTSLLADMPIAGWSGKANRLSLEHVDWDVIDLVDHACRKPPTPRDILLTSWTHDPAATSSAVTGYARPSVTPGLTPTTPRPTARRVIFQRRSAVAMDGKSSISASDFFLMLDRTMPRFDRAPFVALGSPAALDLALFVHRVRDVEPGLYFLTRDPRREAALREAMNPEFRWESPKICPAHLPLALLTGGDARRVSAQISCHQEIAADGAFSLGMIADFEGSLTSFGPWFYRRLFWEAGVIGQALYQEAEAAGFRGTGIGCYFDDAMHSLLGLRDQRFQSLYHFTIGAAKEDLRLMSWPPYASR